MAPPVVKVAGELAGPLLNEIVPTAEWCSECRESGEMQAVLSGIRLRFPSVSQVSPATLSQWLEEGDGSDVLLVDTRQREEFDVSHLPGAVLLQYDDVTEMDEAGLLDLPVTRGLPQDNARRSQPMPRRIVCYCSVGYRSSDVARRLRPLLAVGVPGPAQGGGHTDSSGSTVTLRALLTQDHPPGTPITVHNLEGSAFVWCNEGRPMVDMRGEPTTWCHPYSKVWQYLLHAPHRRWTS